MGSLNRGDHMGRFDCIEANSLILPKEWPYMKGYWNLRLFEHSRFDSKIKKKIIEFTSLTASKMLFFHARAIERTHNLIIIFLKFSDI